MALQASRRHSSGIRPSVGKRRGLAENGEERAGTLAEPDARQQRYKERLALLGTFAAGLVHELTNAVSSIEGGAEYALETADAELRQKLLRAVLADSARCRRTIESLSKFLMTGILEKQPANLPTLVRRCVEMAQSESEVLTTDVDIDPTAKIVWCDPIALEQVIVNILKNALRAGDGRSHVDIRARRLQNRVRITCHDYGPGMEPKHLHHIFEPFYSTWKERGGMGLGLTIARAIMEALGGGMNATSKIGRGTTFVLDLPVQPRTAARSTLPKTGPG